MQLWCGYLCSPFQKNFVVADTAIRGRPVRHVTYSVDPTYASKIYDSCKDGTMDGGVVVGQAFQSYEDFISFAALTILGMQRITVEYRPASQSAYTAAATPCVGNCPCETCQDSCQWTLAINGTGCHVGMFGGEWRCETLVLAISYYVFMVGLAAGIVVWYFLKARRNLEASVVWFSSLLLPIAGVVLIGVGLLLWPAMLDSHDVHVFGTYWSWATASLVGLGLVLIAVGFVFAACVVVRLLLLERSAESVSFATTPRFASSHSADMADDIVARMPKFGTSTVGGTSDLAALASQARYEQKSWLQQLFYQHAKFCASRPLTVIAITAVVITAASLGLIFVQWNNDPVTLWSSPSSRSSTELAFFNSEFGPFYRIEQMIITSQDPSVDMLSNDILNLVLDKQNAITSMVATYYDPDGVAHNTTFQDLCFRPTPGSACLIESPLEWWQSMSNHSLLISLISLLSYTHIFPIGSGTRLNNTADPASYIERVCLTSVCLSLSRMHTLTPCSLSLSLDSAFDCR